MSLTLEDTSPLQLSGLLELFFLCFCSVKLFTKFDVPTTNPQPLLNDRSWEYVYDSLWKSQKTIENKRKFLTAWFYDVNFERLRKEDVIRFLAWMHFGIREEDMTPAQRSHVELKDLPRLEEEVNYGVEFPPGSIHEEALGCIRFNLEPLRFRHKPLLFYMFTHGVRFYMKQELKKLGFSYNPPKDSKRDLGYFYRPGKSSSSQKSSIQTPLVFVHGVGGISYYFNVIKDIGNKNDSPIILVDLPFISLQVSDDIPSVIDQVQSVCNILDENVGKNVKATFVGHSFGSLILSWMVQSSPERVANCVFLDPICFQLYLRNALFNFHFQRVDQSIREKKWENPFSAGSFVNLAGTEMHTNNAMLRHFWWATNVLWPADLEEKKIPASIMVSENDEIVPSAEIEELFSNYNRERKSEKTTINQRKRGSSSSFRPSFMFPKKLEQNVPLRANILFGANHGEFVFDDNLRNKVVRTVLAMMRLNNITEKKKKKMMMKKEQLVHKEENITNNKIAAALHQ